MLTLHPDVPIYLHMAPTDMRKSFTGLCGLVEQAQLELTGGGLFVFVNKIKNRMKILAYEKDGLAIWYKCLEAGRFQWPVSCGQDAVVIDASQLRLILDGIDFYSVKRRKRCKTTKSCG